MKYALLALCALIAGAAYVEMRLRNPTCPRCLALDWDKHLLNDWRCRRCHIKYDVVTGDAYYKPFWKLHVNSCN